MWEKNIFPTYFQEGATKCDSYEKACYMIAIKPQMTFPRRLLLPVPFQVQKSLSDWNPTCMSITPWLVISDPIIALWANKGFSNGELKSLLCLSYIFPYPVPAQFWNKNSLGFQRNRTTVSKYCIVSVTEMRFRCQNRFQDLKDTDPKTISYVCYCIQKGVQLSLKYNRP